MNRTHLFYLLLLALSACQSANPGTEGAARAAPSRAEAEPEASPSRSANARTLEEILELMSLELKATLADRSEALHISLRKIDNLTDEFFDATAVGARVKAAVQKTGKVSFDSSPEEKRRALDEYEASGGKTPRPDFKPVEALLTGRIKRLEDAKAPEAARYKLMLSLHRLEDEQPFWTSEKSFR